MVSELFFYILTSKVGRYFAKNPLTQTLTHITIVFYGQGIINLQLLAPTLKNPKSFRNLPTKYSASNLCRSNNFALGIAIRCTLGRSLFIYLITYRFPVTAPTDWR